MQRVINFSGGKTSALMTILEYKEGDLVIFCDTGREHPKTYKFINDFEAFENIPIIRLTYEGGFRKLIAHKKAIPNQAKRFCTIELKIKTARRYLRTNKIMKYENLVGFRFDEQLRIKRRKQYWKTVKDVFPLNDIKFTKHHVNEYWKNKPYTLELEPILGNCVMCFQKGKDALISILMQYPEYATEWIEDEKLMNYTYLKDYSMEQLLKIANYMNKTKQINLFDVKPAFDCDCGA